MSGQLLHTARLVLLERRRLGVLAAALIAACVVVLRLIDRNPADAPSVLLVVPVALVAIAFGVRGASRPASQRPLR